MTNIDPSTIADSLRDSLAKGQHPWLTVTSNSMAPLFWANDLVILEVVQPEQLNPGDIVTLIDTSNGANSLLTHRIWVQRDNGYITRGDHALSFDEICRPDDILGRVIGRSHRQRTLFFKDGLGHWLNRHLTALARREHRWLTGSQEAPQTGVEPVTFNSRTKFVHRLFFSWSIFITIAVNLAARVKPGENKI